MSNILLVLLFIIIGGVFAAAEMALVSLRDSQVKALSTRGKRGQTVARLAEDPNLFLSAVQIGVTLAGFLSASFGAATLAPEFIPVLRGWGVPAGASSANHDVASKSGNPCSTIVGKSGALEARFSDVTAIPLTRPSRTSGIAAPAF